MNNYETKIEQLQKKAKSDLDREKDEKEKALAKVSTCITFILDSSFACFQNCICLER